MPKVVIDISDADYKSITEDYISYADTESGRVFKAIKEGTVLPEHPTNGDMIKALFPNNHYEVSSVSINDFNEAMIECLEDDTYFDLDWWNAPYKGGQDGHSD